ncbi:MAG: Sec-dependent nitrous-oxide reductase [Chlorobi bacterium]|nr:Sec-dependent nitrous-oxide reductase [Chlorobiota bacterium]
MKNIFKSGWFRALTAAMALLLITVFAVQCGKGGEEKGGTTKESAVGAPRGKESFQDVVKRRGLNEDDVLAAVKTYTPDNLKDEGVAANSGGQEGNMPTYVFPSMRMVKYIPINTRQPYAGFGYSEETYNLMKDGFIDGAEILWGDTHHPGFSETDGVYNGKWLCINDKANPRIYIVDLRDWYVKQIIQNPIFRSDHGGSFFTPNSEYIMEACQYPAPYDHKYHELTEANFKKYWRGGLTYWKFDNESGKVDLNKSFTFEFPPYTQDLSDAGKAKSYGWGFTNSFCTEMYFGGIEAGRPPFEAGCSSRDVDYLHVTNWKKAEELFKAGKIGKKVVNGMHVITIDEAVKNGLLYLIPEPKSPHGVDVSPCGKYIIVAGKLDSHAWVYDFDKIMKAIKDKNFEGKDEFGIPIIPLKAALHKSVEVGLGPLHNQFDSRDGVIYTSIYVDSRVTKWNYKSDDPEGKNSVLAYVPSHYNIGHLVSYHGDTKKPRGKYLIALNKLSIDRFNPVGPLHPQNHQLIDIESEQPKIIYDLPLPMGEPHYTAMIGRDVYEGNAMEVYPVGTDITTMSKSKYAINAGEEKTDTKGNTVEIFGTIKDGKVTPANIEVTQGQDVVIHLTNLGQSVYDHYVYEIASYDKMYAYAPGETATIKFNAEKSGVYPILLDAQNSPSKRQLVGYLTVKFDQAAEKKRVLAYTDRIKWDQEVQAFKPSAIELKNMLPGEIEFLNYGCNACHKFGEDFNGPDLLMVHKRRSKEWLKDWILHTEKHHKDPDIVALANKFKLYMPNQHVDPKDVDKLIEYMKAKSEQVIKEKAGK